MGHPAILFGFLGFGIFVIAVFEFRSGITESQGGAMLMA
jgi:hypothetical protein